MSWEGKVVDEFVESLTGSSRSRELAGKRSTNSPETGLWCGAGGAESWWGVYTKLNKVLIFFKVFSLFS